MSPSATFQTQTGRYSIVKAEVPGHGLVNLGVLLQDPQSDALHLRFRRDLDSLLEEEDLEALEGLSDDLSRKASELGADRLFEYLESTLSASIRVTDRDQILVDDFTRALNRLYRKHVPSKVLEFRTHLPRYSLQVAAGKFLENNEVTEQGWIEAPQDLRLAPDMFVAQIAGHSMEPLIPDGSLCVFRAGVTGSRAGRLVLAEDREANAFAVKRYKSEKEPTREKNEKPDTKKEGENEAPQEGWRHGRIRLESLNPGYPSWDLDPDEEKYRILAEFVQVLD
jgi:SOS-response transcriptional repressor LexA